MARVCRKKMNKKQRFIAAIISFSLSLTITQQAWTVDPKKAVPVADQFYAWDCPEGNLGISISAKFNSRQQMEATLNLSKAIGTYQSKKWKLSMILVSANFNFNGDSATWEVSGPKPLLMRYLRGLELQYKDNSLFYDFGYFFIDFEPSGYWEKE